MIESVVAPPENPLLESTTPSGDRELHSWSARAVATLCPAYTDDGGHLNAAARVSMAQQLVAVLAARGRPE
jgi:lysophospholipase L1-like esterase